MTRRLLHRLADPAGFVMPAVIGLSALLMILTAVAVTAVVTAQDSANRDRQRKLARQAADAGVELALFRLNAVVAGEALPCAVKDAGGNLALSGYDAGGQWCAPVADTLADGATTTYRVSAETPIAGTNPPEVRRRVVATGVYGSQQRRVFAEIAARRGIPAWAAYGVSAKERIFLANTARIGDSTNPVDVRTNGDIEMQHTSRICGEVHPGPGRTLTRAAGAALCPGMSTSPATSTLAFDDLDAEHAAARTTNDNARLSCATPAPRDISCPPGDVSWNAASRALSLTNAASLTLAGDVYSLCRLSMQQSSTLYIAPRPANAPPLKIYFDSPENCGGQTQPISLQNGIGITNLNSHPVTLQLLVRGSSTVSTQVHVANSASNSVSTPMMLYAPNSSVLLENAGRMSGALVGKSVTIINSASVDNDRSVVPPTGATALVYQPVQHRECAPAAGASPDAGC